MRFYTVVFLGFLSSVLPCIAEDHVFDGAWQTTVSCENAAGALGYSYRFDSQVNAGVLHGEKGEKDKPGWFQLDGKIGPDGKGRFFADGLVGAAETAVGRRPAGTRFSYHVDVSFTRDSGTGKRVEGRPCTIEFKKN